jgi:hypothetical protein
LCSSTPVEVIIGRRRFVLTAEPAQRVRGGEKAVIP